MGGVNWKRNLAVVWLSQFLGMGGFACAMPFIPLLLRDNFGITDDSVRGAYVSAYYFCGTLSFTIATMFWGMMADRFGYKIMLLRASYAAAFFFPCLAYAPSVGWLLAIRVVTSFFSGTFNAAQTLLVCTTPPDKHGFALGSLSTALWSGNMAGFLAGGLIVHYFGYTAAFVTCGSLYFIGGLLVHLFVRDDFHGRPVVPKTRSETVRRPPGILSLPALLLLGLFLLLGVARRIEEPFLAMMVEIVHGRSKAAFFTGVVSAAAALGGLLSGVSIGYLSDRIAPRRLLFPLLFFSAAATFMQAVAPNVAVLAIMRFLTYFAAGGLVPVMQVMLARNTDPAHRGTFFGLATSFNNIGGVVCTFISGAIAYFFNVRGILLTAAGFYLLMVPYSALIFRRKRG